MKSKVISAICILVMAGFLMVAAGCGGGGGSASGSSSAGISGSAN
jgi:hypothetical protein